jgi:hypothetical protein
MSTKYPEVVAVFYNTMALCYELTDSVGIIGTSNLQCSGEKYIWSGKAGDDGFASGSMKIRCRPRVTLHGRSTKTALGK